MPYATLDVTLARHPKTVAAGWQAFGLHVAGILYAREHLTDGRIPAGALGGLLADLPAPKARQLAARLVEAGLWEPAEGGYLIHDWLDWNPSAATLRVKREAGRARALAWRTAHDPRTNGVRTSYERETSGVRTAASRARVESESEIETEKQENYEGGLASAVAPLGGSPSRRERRQAAMAILAFLNERAGRFFKPVPGTLRLIEARLAEGATPEDCRVVIARKVRAWKGDPKMAEFLRPETLFNATKFASYIGEVPPEPEADGGVS